MSNSKRIFIYGPVAALVLLALAYSIYWFVTAGRVTAELERLDGNEIVPGLTLQFAEMEVGGFPFRLDVRLNGVTIAVQGQDGVSAWRSERVALHAKPYGPAHYVFEAEGLQTFTWPAEAGAPQSILHISSGITRANAFIEEGRLSRFDIDILNAEGMDASLGAAPMREFRVARARLQLLAEDDATLGLEVAVDAAEIGTGYRPALGTNLSRVRAEGRISEANALQELGSGTMDVRATLETWRNAGGTIILDPIEAAWGGTLLLGTAELMLDQEHRLTGLLTAAPEDPVSFLGALSQSEMIPDTARAQLAGFREMAAGLPGNLDLPIRLEAHLPLGPEPTIPSLQLQGMNGIVVIFGGAP